MLCCDRFNGGGGDGEHHHVGALDCLADSDDNLAAGAVTPWTP